MSYVDSSVVDGLPRLTMPSYDAYLQENTEALRPSTHSHTPSLLLQQSSKHRQDIKEGFLREVAKFKTRGAHYGCLWVLNLKGWRWKRVQVLTQFTLFYHKCDASVVWIRRSWSWRSPRTTVIHKSVRSLWSFSRWNVALLKVRGHHRFLLLYLADPIIKDKTCKEEWTFSLCAIWMPCSRCLRCAFFDHQQFSDLLAYALSQKKRSKKERGAE